MKRILLPMILILILSACARSSQQTAQSILPVDDARTPQAELTPAERAAISRLASTLNLSAGKVSVISTEAAQWSDGCLGVQRADALCTQAAVTGYKIMLQANGLTFEYHVSADGGLIQPATLAFVWTRDGGFAGFCDTLTVFLSGEVYRSNCHSGQLEEAMMSLASLLTEAEQKQFFAWVQKFGQVSLQVSDPLAAADRMDVTLVFYGNGQSQPSTVEKQVLMAFAQKLYQNLGAK